jgi:hypothetical protein
MSTFDIFNEFFRIETPSILISPYLSLRPCQYFLDGKKPNKIITTFDADIFFGCSSDIRAIQWLLDQGIEVKYIDSLHAKMYVGKDLTLVGSANFTNRGIGMPGCQANLESVFMLDNSVSKIETILSIIITRAKLVSQDMVCSILESISLPTNKTEVPNTIEWNRVTEQNWTPRSPYIRDYYYLTQSRIEMTTERELTGIIEDLRYLDLPASFGNEDAFKKNLRETLQNEPVFIPFIHNDNVYSDPVCVTQHIKSKYRGISTQMLYCLTEWLVYIYS